MYVCLASWGWGLGLNEAVDEVGSLSLLGKQVFCLDDNTCTSVSYMA